ncbi:MAG: DUF1254 domain-containing protein [Rhizobiales bacterium]|nr:DUF1254 domain-containing protein [Hyphomicrobiales bacterium]
MRAAAFTLLLLVLACAGIGPGAAQTPKDAQAIAAEAYIYGFPLVDNYRVMSAYFIDSRSPEYKGPPNRIYNVARVYTPADTAVQTPNSDTPYSFAWLDLRTEPVVLTLPPIEKDRYYSVQLVDLYTFNFAYLGTRATGNNGGKFLIAGPDWTGTAPPGIDKVIRAETQFVFALYRTQLFDPADIANVGKIQSGYGLELLSKFAGTAPPEPAPDIEFIKALTPAEERDTLDFFNVLNFVLQYCPVEPSERDLRARFEQIGVVPGLPLIEEMLPPEMATALKAGMADGQKEIDVARAASTSSADLFGSRAEMKNNFLNRAVGAQVGIYGNSIAEALYDGYEADSSGAPLDAATGRYTLHFDKDKLPPARAFWSLTMYDLPRQLLVANPIDRYLINSLMLDSLKRDGDGGITLYLQKDSPGAEKEPNWLPAPDGRFFAVLRLYLPEPQAISGEWKQPPMLREP